MLTLVSYENWLFFCSGWKPNFWAIYFWSTCSQQFKIRCTHQNRNGGMLVEKAKMCHSKFMPSLPLSENLAPWQNQSKMSITCQVVEAFFQLHDHAL